MLSWSVFSVLFSVSITVASSGLNETKWLQSCAQGEKLCATLNTTEKASIVTGSMTGLCIEYVAPVESIVFGGLCLQDGPAAIRLADLASVFPAGVTVAATWDREMMYERGTALAEEFKGKGAHVALGLVLSIPLSTRSKL